MDGGWDWEWWKVEGGGIRKVSLHPAKSTLNELVAEAIIWGIRMSSGISEGLVDGESCPWALKPKAINSIEKKEGGNVGDGSSFGEPHLLAGKEGESPAQAYTPDDHHLLQTPDPTTPKHVKCLHRVDPVMNTLQLPPPPLNKHNPH